MHSYIRTYTCEGTAVGGTGDCCGVAVGVKGLPSSAIPGA